MAGVAGQSLGSGVVFPGVTSQVLLAPVLGRAAGIVARNHLMLIGRDSLAIVVGYGIEKAGGRSGIAGGIQLMPVGYFGTVGCN